MKPLLKLLPSTLAVLALLIALSTNVAAASPGDPDTRLGVDGWRMAQPPSLNSMNYSDTIPSADESTYVFGSKNLSGGGAYPAMTRITADGSLDTSFGTSGYVTEYNGSSNQTSTFATGVEQPDGKLVVVYHQYSGAYTTSEVKRYNANGTIDTSFTKYTLSNSSNTSYSYKTTHAVGLSSTGQVYWVVEKKLNSTTSEVQIRRFSSSGTLDTSYGSSGVASQSVISLNILRNAQFYENPFGGGMSIFTLIKNGSSAQILKFAPNGTLDSGFGTSGAATLASNAAYTFSVDSAARPVFGWASSGDISVRRLDADGSVDSDFGASGEQLVDLSGSNLSDGFKQVLATENNQILVTGTYSSSGTRIGYVALHPDGTLDSGFGAGGRKTARYRYSSFPSDAIPKKISITEDGWIHALAWETTAVLARYENVDAWNDFEATYETVFVRQGVGLPAPVSPDTGGLYGAESIISATSNEPLNDAFNLNASTGAISLNTSEPLPTDGVNSFDHTYDITLTTSYGRVTTVPVRIIVVPANPAQQFRPILRFDSAEHWRPLNVDAFFSEGSQSYASGSHRICRDEENDKNQNNDTCGAWISSVDDIPDCDYYPDETCDFNYANQAYNYYIDIHGEYNNSSPSLESAQYHSPSPECVIASVYDCDTDPDISSIYYNTTHHSGMTYFDYWIMYRFDEVHYAPSSMNHEGDWESITLAVDDSDPSTFQYAAFNAHKGPAWKYLREVLSCDGSTNAGTCGVDANAHGNRINVFVANGTHASYPQACDDECKQTGSDGESALGYGDSLWMDVEGEYDGQVSWGNNNIDDALEPMPESSGYRAWEAADLSSNKVQSVTWTNWPGWWGQFNLEYAPDSPGVRPIRYYQPWLKENCTTRWSGANTGCIRADFLPYPNVNVWDEGQSIMVEQDTEINFDADMSGPITSSGWDFTGNYNESSQNWSDDDLNPKNASGVVGDATHTFTNPGPYKVTLQVKDSTGFIFHITKKVCVDTCETAPAAERSSGGLTTMLADHTTYEKSQTSCADWSGPYVQVAICEPGNYEAWLKGRLRRPASVPVFAPGYTVAEAPGITQVFGREPLRVGAKVRIEGSISADTKMTVKSKYGEHLTVSEFEHVGSNVEDAVVTTYKSSTGAPAIRLKVDGRSLVPKSSTHGR